MADLRSIAAQAAQIVGPMVQRVLKPSSSPYDPQGDTYEVPWRFADIAQAALKAAKYKAGEYIASTPEGQAAIKENLRQQALAKAQTFGKYAIPLGIGVAVLLLATRRR